MFLYDFATKTAQKPDTVATYIRRNEKIIEKKNLVQKNMVFDPCLINYLTDKRCVFNLH